jgi:hypothetical protein
VDFSGWELVSLLQLKSCGWGRIGGVGWRDLVPFISIREIYQE